MFNRFVWKVLASAYLVNSVLRAYAFPRIFGAVQQPYDYSPEAASARDNGFLFGIVRPISSGAISSIVPSGFPIIEGATNLLRVGAYSTLEELANLRSSIAAAGKARFSQEAEMIRDSAQRAIAVGEKVTAAAATTVRSFENGAPLIERALYNGTREVADRRPGEGAVGLYSNENKGYGTRTAVAQPAPAAHSLGGTIRTTNAASSDTSLLGSALELTSRIAQEGVATVFPSFSSPSSPPSAMNAFSPASMLQPSSQDVELLHAAGKSPDARQGVSYATTKTVTTMPALTPTAAVPVSVTVLEEPTRYAGPLSDLAESAGPRTLERRRHHDGARRSTHRRTNRKARPSRTALPNDGYAATEAHDTSRSPGPVSSGAGGSSYYHQPAVMPNTPSYTGAGHPNIGSTVHNSDSMLMEGQDYFPAEDLHLNMYS